MTREELLFRAIGGADPELVERCRRPVRRSYGRWLGWSAAVAACLLLSVGLWRLVPREPPVEPDPPVQDQNPPQDQTDPDQPIVIPAGSSVEGGTAHFLRLTYDLPHREKETADFYISINREQYRGAERDGVYVIEPVTPLPEDFPPCDLQIAHFPDTTLEQAAQAVRDWAAASYAGCEEKGGLFHASDGVAWDAAQADVWLVEDGQGGVYCLTARYFMEAAEGHGVRFRNMVNTFAPADAEDPAAALRQRVSRLAEAIFSENLSGVSELTAPEAEMSGYGADVSGDISISSIDITLGPDGSSATASVEHFTNLEDSANYLTIELALLDGRWLATWSGIEK